MDKHSIANLKKKVNTSKCLSNKMKYFLPKNAGYAFACFIVQALPLNITDLAKLSLPEMRAFMKLLCTFDTAVVSDCQFLWVFTCSICHRYPY